MSTRATNSNWTISRGDYIPDVEYFDEQTKRTTQRKAAGRRIYFVLSLCALTCVVSFIISSLLF